MRNLNNIREIFNWNPRNVIQKLNEIIRAINTLMNFTGDDLVNVKDGPIGRTVGLNWQLLLEKLPRTPLRLCTLTTDVSYDDPDIEATGTIHHPGGDETEVTIYFGSIGTASSSITGYIQPNIANGTTIVVVKDNNGLWNCVQVLQNLLSGRGVVHRMKVQTGGVGAASISCKLTSTSGTELGSAVDVYPIEHLGTNNLSGDVWPKFAAGDYLSAFVAFDGKYYTTFPFDDTDSC